MVSLYNINPDGVYDGQQRSLEDFQFDLERGGGDAGYLCQCQEQDCSRGCSSSCHTRDKEWAEGAVRGACGKHCRTSQSDRA